MNTPDHRPVPEMSTEPLDQPTPTREETEARLERVRTIQKRAVARTLKRERAVASHARKSRAKKERTVELTDRALRLDLRSDFTASATSDGGVVLVLRATVDGMNPPVPLHVFLTRAMAKTLIARLTLAL